ncbi:uncharacterized protein LOC109726544 [Ananas comosus]|uniref:Uncharacterized protein LOC109726544 n=1 Tax=Ananas comosus TaxID=4615 RepID=A0A6P5H149_ANACO|nr:uncharacterized protein LOC109726544 [Ananas comosus]XP_020111772.1 uncharacterized protein LOC109726544 [Ananas comosus]XP_020111773.1 uncharacterized protein LOC109726544 [Ananas comosus]XP_020111774.1 uncharacterized protein LOC109726544 [Ananas comosus]XP_020111775.1 uncharacterized protein LOC109726544 [Ananas comosus]
MAFFLSSLISKPQNLATPPKQTIKSGATKATPISIPMIRTNNIPTSAARRNTLTIRCSSSSSSSPSPTAAPPPKAKIVRCPALDRQAARSSRLRFARKLTALLLSKRRRFLPLRVLRRCRPYLGLSPPRPLLPMILRYPSLFRLFRSPTSSALSVALTPAASALADRQLSLQSSLQSSLPAKLHRLLMLAPHGRLLLAKLAHLAPDLGLPRDFPSAVCPRHPHRFALVDTSYGRALQLTSWDPSLASPSPPLRPSPSPSSDRILDRPLKFHHLHLPLPLPRGLNLRRRHRDYLIRFHALPAPSPYNNRNSDSYNDELAVEDEMLAERERLMELVREGKRMRREMRRGTPIDNINCRGVEEEEEEEQEEEEEDGFEDLLEFGIGGEDWEEIYGEEGGEDDGDEGGDVEEFWVKRAAAAGLVGDGEPKDLEVW